MSLISAAVRLIEVGNHGVDLRCGVTVTALRGDGSGRFIGADLSDGSRVEADVCVVALGAVRIVEWLADSGLAAGPRGVACDAGCRAFTMYGIVTDDVFAAGDVSRFPHPLFEYQMLSLEHWSTGALEHWSTGALEQRGRAGRGGAPGAADRAIAADIPVPSDVPDPKGLSHGPTVALTGYLPDRRLTVVQPRG